MSKLDRIEKLERVLVPEGAVIIGIQDYIDGETVSVSHWRDNECEVETFPNEEAFRAKYPNSFLITVIRETK